MGAGAHLRPVPSTLVHVAVGGLVGVGLLGAGFTRRRIGVVLFAAAVPDLDSVLTFAYPGAHRALLHSFLFPALLGALLLADARRDRPWLRRRFGPGAVPTAGVALAALVVGGILPDLFTNGVNALFPLHDAFYTVEGELLLSDRRGVVQTFVDLSPPEPAPSTDEVTYVTGVDPSAGAEPEEVERVFPVVTSGFRLLIVLTSGFVVGFRSWQATPERDD